MAAQYTKATARVLNHVKFSGKIISLDVSGNHGYGIIGISVLTTNRSEFVDTVESGLFPYRLIHEYAEFCGYAPVEI